MPTEVAVTVASSGGDYASLNAAEADNFGATGADLVTNDENVVCTCEAFVDSVRTDIDGHTTDATRNILIVADVGAEAVMPPVTDGSVYYLRVSVTDNSEALAYNDNYITVRNIFMSAYGGRPNGDVLAPRNTCMSEGCYIWVERDSGNSASIGNSTGGNFRNCVLHNDTDYGKIVNGSSLYVVENCTIRNTGNSTPVQIWYGDSPTIINTVVYTDSSAGFESGTWVAACKNNSSNQSDAEGTDPQDGTPTFVDATNHDYHLASGDTIARGNGYDMSGTYTKDFDEVTRSAWDIGACEFVSGSLVITGTMDGGIMSMNGGMQ